jgi:gentisate 1,2-dioxygenase
VTGETQFFYEIKGETTTAHLHSEDEFFQIMNGQLAFYSTLFSPINLKNNDFVLIPKGRLHSTIAKVENTSYMVQPIKLEGVRI